MNVNRQELLRQLPQVNRLLVSERMRPLTDAFSLQELTFAVRERLDALRAKLLNGSGEEFAFDETRFFSSVREVLETGRKRTLRRVINATGIVIHTNLGRAPLADAAIDALVDVACGYSALEIDLESGGRGSRQTHVSALLEHLTGAEAALVVNNNAAAVVLALNTLALGQEVIVSRGESIEIGGSFRIPDVVTRSGARLVEVGTTNRTRISDYERAIWPDTRVLMKAHPSNYRIVGFAETVSREELAELGRKRGIPVVEDLGSGALIDLSTYGLPHEPTVREVLSTGVNVVTFSGDKLLGGPQCGVIAGDAELIGRMKANPLARALRIDKLSLAALEATLRLYNDSDRLRETLPVLRMLTMSREALDAKLARLLDRATGSGGLQAEIVDGEGYAGGGSLPDEALPSRLLALSAANLTADELVTALRRNDPPIIARIADGRVVLDVRTIADDEIEEVAEALRRITA